MLSLLRILKFSLQDMLRNISLSLMTILILVLMLLSVNTLLIIRVLTDEATQSIKNQIDVSVYFSPDVSSEKLREIQEYIKSFPEVTEMTLLTREEVLAQFRKTHEDNPEIIASLNELEENPLGPTLIVKTREPSEYQKIIASLDVPEYEHLIEAKTFEDTEKAIGRIHTITTQVERFSYALTVLFAVIAFLIIFNTIRVAIYTQRAEISIKKLVGASNWFVRGPYVIESFFFSIVSTAIAALLVLFASRLLDPYIEVVFGSEKFLTNYFNSHMLLLFGGQFTAVFLLTIFSSLLAMRRYLRV